MTLRQITLVGLIAATLGSASLSLTKSMLHQGGADGLKLYRSVAAATLAYSADHDGLLPLMAGTDQATGVIRTMQLHRVAAGWQDKPPHNQSQRIREDSQIWANSILEYLPTSSVLPLMHDGLPLTRFKGINYDLQNPKTQRHPVGVSYNGLLHAWSKDAISLPAKLPLYSGMFYRQNLDGLAISNPALMCQAINTCRFHPTNTPHRMGNRTGSIWLPIGPKERMSVWVIREGMNFASADGSAYWKSMTGIPRFPERAFNVNDVPWGSLDPKGVAGTPYWLTECAAPGSSYSKDSTVYAGYFRPDSTFEWTPRECNSGQ